MILIWRQPVVTNFCFSYLSPITIIWSKPPSNVPFYAIIMYDVIYNITSYINVFWIIQGVPQKCTHFSVLRPATKFYHSGFGPSKPKTFNSVSAVDIATQICNLLRKHMYVLEHCKLLVTLFLGPKAQIRWSCVSVPNNSVLVPYGGGVVGSLRPVSPQPLAVMS